MHPVKDPQVDEFIESLETPVQDIVSELRTLVFEAYPEMDEGFKWDKPSYAKEGLVCYMQTAKGHVNFGFYRGAELRDESKLLAGDGKKMRDIRLNRTDDIPTDALKLLIWDAVELNRK